ncbi:hypothetical protein Victoria_0097 [Pseudomonas phage Victoria]|nr:hypothetical protein Victoria_0097 [Pseudomonas phage Victoria]
MPSMGGNIPDGAYRSSTLRNISQFCFTSILNSVIISSSNAKHSKQRNAEMTKSQINDQIRSAKIAISEAEMEGLRGQAMIALKAKLTTLKAQYKLAK